MIVSEGLKETACVETYNVPYILYIHIVQIPSAPHEFFCEYVHNSMNAILRAESFYAIPCSVISGMIYHLYLPTSFCLIFVQGVTILMILILVAL